MILSVLSFTSASSADAEREILGWLSVEIDRALVLDGIALRRTAGGTLTLSFAERRDASRRRHLLVRSLDDDARQAIEKKVFEALEVKGDLP